MGSHLSIASCLVVTSQDSSVGRSHGDSTSDEAYDMETLTVGRYTVATFAMRVATPS